MRTGEQPLRGVGQDKSASKRERVASPQPASRYHLTRSRQMNTLFSCSQNYFKDSFLTIISCISFRFSLAWVSMSYPALPRHQSPNHVKKHSTKRQMVQLTIWLTP